MKTAISIPDPVFQAGEALDLSENSKASLFKALKQNFDICVKT